MKLKHLILILVVMMLILICGNSEVKALTERQEENAPYIDYFTWFYFTKNADGTWNTNGWEKGKKVWFNDSNENYLKNTMTLGEAQSLRNNTTPGFTGGSRVFAYSWNIFCLEPNKDRPSQLIVDHIFTSYDGKTFTWKDNSEKFYENKTTKILYVYSTLNNMGYTEARGDETKSPEEYAIWNIIGEYTNFSNPNPNRTTQILANADAYYTYWTNNYGDYTNRININNIKEENNKLGPFTLDYKMVAPNDISNGIYGQIQKIELVSNINSNNTVVFYEYDYETGKNKHTGMLENENRDD